MTLARFEHATRQILHRLRTARNVGTDSSSEKPPGDTHLKSTSSNPTRDHGTCAGLVSSPGDRFRLPNSTAGN